MNWAEYGSGLRAQVVCGENAVCGEKTQTRMCVSCLQWGKRPDKDEITRYIVYARLCAQFVSDCVRVYEFSTAQTIQINHEHAAM